MKKFLFISILIFSTVCTFASHIVGGEVFYKYIGPGAQANSSSYEVTLRLFTSCGQACGGNSNIACPPLSTQIGIFTNAAPYAAVTYITLQNTGNPQINLTTYPACIDNKPTVCYQVNTYSTTVELANNAAGYRLAYQSCCRAAAQNMIPNGNNVSGQPGATYEATIPGTSLVPTGSNSTAVVNLKDTALICHNSQFTLEFSAIDPDNDVLTYEFISAYNGGSATGSVDAANPDNPLYGTISYNSGYSGVSPLGPGVTINASTGVISGISPATVGLYVVNVLVKEWRGGINIAEHRKDFLIKVNDCNETKSQLQPSYLSCDGFTLNFENLADNPNIQTYYWDFGDGNSSTEEAPSHTYATAGTYTVKLVVNKGLECTDSATAPANVYPGFRPALEIDGQCKNTAIQFKDRTVADFGTVNKWSWSFGDPGSAHNTSTSKDTSHVYAAANTYLIHFVVSSDKGCTATIDTSLLVTDKPSLSVTHDTLICTIDTLQLNAVGAGTFLWSPNYNISSTVINNPLVSPDVTTTYKVQLTDAFGCVGTDSVKVKVISVVALSGPADTTICQTDRILINESSDGLRFAWTPNDGTINDTTLLRPTVRPLTTTTYHVVASVGKCFSEDDVKVVPVPYPKANAGPDVPVCFGFSTQLHATGGAYYSWSPTLFLDNPRSANPRVISPTTSVQYVVTIRDTLGCPKPVTDTSIVTVVRIIASAGPRDTSVVLGQPLQLTATGGKYYTWLPDNRWLSSTIINNPVALPQDNILYNVRVSDDNGCIGTASIQVYLYNLKAGLYIPNAFTPNGDGINDIFRPIELGISTLDLFRIYNRFGEMVFSTSDMKQGWDGNYKGKGQDPGTYVWYAEGTDYTGKKVFKKGSVILIR